MANHALCCCLRYMSDLNSHSSPHGKQSLLKDNGKYIHHRLPASNRLDQAWINVGHHLGASFIGCLPAHK